MRMSFTGYVFVLVVLGSLGASAFRVSTAPERIRERHDVARQVCLERGGVWQQIDERHSDLKHMVCSPATART